MPLRLSRPSNSNFSNIADLPSVVLAVQNMEASGTVAKAQEIEFKALEGSLSMMSKGLSFLSVNSGFFFGQLG